MAADSERGDRKPSFQPHQLFSVLPEVGVCTRRSWCLKLSLPLFKTFVLTHFLVWSLIITSCGSHFPTLDTPPSPLLSQRYPDSLYFIHEIILLISFPRRLLKAATPYQLEFCAC